MSFASVAAKALPQPLRKQRNLIREAWDHLHSLPGGKRIFSRLVGRAAPYTGTIAAVVTELEHGSSRVVMRDRPRLRNHLSSVHAIALANLVELTGNIAVAYSLPDDARFIVAGMKLQYLKKARGTITGECQIALPDTAERREIDVPVLLRDEAGDTVVEATLQTLIGPKKN